LINFSLFDLVGKRLTPRMRDLTKVTLIRDDTPTVINLQYPNAGPLLNARWGEALVEETWDDLLRMGASLKYGQATASLVVGKWSAAPRQNTLATALKEWGVLRRTLHALRRDLHYAQQGTITARPYLADQTEQQWCLVVWTTEYFGLAVQQLRADGKLVDDELLGHISPGRSENINFFGAIPVEVEAELAKLDNGWRPLRAVRSLDGAGLEI
jgi:TnpA family transposase